VAGHRVDHLLRIAALLKLGQRVARVPRVEVGIALVVEVVNEPGDGPELLVLAVAAGVGPHPRLDRERMLAQRLRLGPIAEKRPGLIAGRSGHLRCYPSRAFGRADPWRRADLRSPLFAGISWRN
jgi:hypothetical protein